jgi:hypothetical protein
LLPLHSSVDGRIGAVSVIFDNGTRALAGALSINRLAAGRAASPARMNAIALP